jgi:hypothetical protein
MEMGMSEKEIFEGLEEEVRGLKDPGITLIVLYISIVLFLLLFAGLEGVQADLGGVEVKTLTADTATCRGELPGWEENRSTAAPILSLNTKITVSDGIMKRAIPSELFLVLGIVLLLLALFLAKDGKNH